MSIGEVECFQVGTIVHVTSPIDNESPVEVDAR